MNQTLRQYWHVFGLFGNTAKRKQHIKFILLQWKICTHMYWHFGISTNLQIIWTRDICTHSTNIYFLGLSWAWLLYITYHRHTSSASCFYYYFSFSLFLFKPIVIFTFASFEFSSDTKRTMPKFTFSRRNKNYY